jgi:predicted nucleic acid-binding Zn ribbon protein
MSPSKPPRKPQGLGSLLTTYFEDHPEKEKVMRGRILSVWKEALGPTLAQRVSRVHFERDVLIFTVPDAAWRHEIHMNQVMITQKLNDLAGDQVVQQLRVRG